MMTRPVPPRLALVAAAALTWVGGCAPNPGASPAARSPVLSSSAANAAREVTAIADEYLREWQETFPVRALLAGYPSERNDRMEDNSLAALGRWQAREDAALARLAAVDPGRLWGTPEWVTYGLLREHLEAARATRICRSELWSVNHMSGWQVALGQLAQIQPLGTPELRAQALARWRLIPDWLETDMANLREGMRLGYSTPKRNVRLVIQQLDAVLAAPERSPLSSPAQRDSTPEFGTEWAALIAQEIIPALRRYRESLAGEYLAAARDAIGVSANPDGAACWRARFRSYTTIDRAPEETHRIGEQRVAQNGAEAERIAREMFGTADLDSLVERVRQDPRRHFSSREELLAFARDAVERARVATPRWFRTLPRAEVAVEPHPAYLERTASDQYFAAPIDGSRPAYYRINLYEPERRTRAATERTAFHETFPGHHLQVGLALERGEGHPVARIARNSALIEGWARYAEALAEEMGLYSEPSALISRRMWPARGMVVDPGVHLMGWTHEQAVQYVLAGGGSNRRTAEALVDRLIAWPAQLTAYDTGGLEFFALRQRAELELGSRFDIREFHDVVLGHGTITLPMLREVVDRWIREKH